MEEYCHRCDGFYRVDQDGHVIAKCDCIIDRDKNFASKFKKAVEKIIKDFGKRKVKK